MTAKRRRPTRRQAIAAVRRFLGGAVGRHFADNASSILHADGEDGYSFCLTRDDTTSYVHADLSIEWYGTSLSEAAAKAIVP